MKAQVTTEFLIAIGFVMGIFLILGSVVNNMFFSDSLSYDASNLFLDELKSKIDFLNFTSNNVKIPITIPKQIDNQPYDISLTEDTGSKETIVKIVLADKTISSQRMATFKESPNTLDINTTKGPFILVKNNSGIFITQ